MKVKTFETTLISDLEENINTFLSEEVRLVTNIAYSTCTMPDEQGLIFYSVVIFYN